MTTLGIDVSHYQGQVDWHAVSRSEVRFAFIKASEGAHVDALFEQNWTGARDVGLLHGAYHFARPDGDAETQAAHFASVVGPAAWGELPPVLDLEVMGALKPEGVIQWTLAFVEKAEALFGRPLMIYTGALWRNQLHDPIVAELKNRLLWTARYGTREPVVPKNWTRWDFWQFTDGQNGDVVSVPGIRGKCDCNRYRGDLAELQALQGSGAPKPVEAPPADSSTDTLKWDGQHLIWPHRPPLRSDRIRVWQERMRERGFSVDVDGVYGPESKVACIAFQRHAGLTPDGIVGRSTWESTFDPNVG